MKRKIIMLCGSRSRLTIDFDPSKFFPNDQDFIVGDCYGADAAWQVLMHDDCIYHDVYYIGNKPRCITSAGKAVFVSSEGNQIAKDDTMFDLADEVWAAWDGRSRGTRRVIEKAEASGKAVKLF